MTFDGSDLSRSASSRIEMGGSALSSWSALACSGREVELGHGGGEMGVHALEGELQQQRPGLIGDGYGAGQARGSAAVHGQHDSRFTK